MSCPVKLHISRALCNLISPLKPSLIVFASLSSHRVFKESPLIPISCWEAEAPHAPPGRDAGSWRCRGDAAEVPGPGAASLAGPGPQGTTARHEGLLTWGKAGAGGTAAALVPLAGGI